MKHYTLKQAIKEVDDSVDYKLALKVSIKKWMEIIKYEERYYKVDDACGYCLVGRNIAKFDESACNVCTTKVWKICDKVKIGMTKNTMKQILKKLRRLK